MGSQQGLLLQMGGGGAMAKGSTPTHQVEHSKDPWLPWEEAAQDVEGTGVSRERRGDKHGDRGTPRPPLVP